MAGLSSRFMAGLSRILRRQLALQFHSAMLPPPRRLLDPPTIPEKLLLGPGPSNMIEAVRDAQTAPLLGHLHVEFIQIMDDVREGIQYAFQTTNPLTLAVSGTGHAGMECALTNVIEKDDRLLVVEIGLWGQRAADLGRRLGAHVEILKRPEGEAVTFDQFRKAVIDFNPQLVFVCHGESSTGVLQPLDGLGAVCHEQNVILIVDTVASLGGAPFEIDVVYSATQKVLNCPPGLAPISFNQRAIDKIKARKSPVPSFYFDALLLANYWGCFGEPRRYHHTAPISTVYALRAALSAFAKEGVEASVERHRKNSLLLYENLKSIGLELFVDEPSWRLPCLTTVRVPESVDWRSVVEKLMANKVEIAGGLGPTVGKLWRIGTFGVNSSAKNIERVCAELKTALGSS